jgi:hypothetical protein
VAARFKAWVYGRSLAGIVGSNPTGGMDVCVVFVVRTVVWNVKWHEGRKDLNSIKMDQRGEKNPGQKEKSRRGHGCLCCVCCIRSSMEHKWHEEGRKNFKVQNGSKGKNGQEKKRLRHGCLSLVSVVCCQVEVSATSWSLVQGSPTECGVSKKCVTMKPRRNEEAQAHIGLSSHAHTHTHTQKRKLD